MYAPTADCDYRGEIYTINLPLAYVRRGSGVPLLLCNAPVTRSRQRLQIQSSLWRNRAKK